MLARAEPAPAPDAAPPLRFSVGVAIVTVAFLVAATFGWYALREARLIGPTTSVVGVYTAGVLVWLLALWAFRGVAPWRLGRETLVVIGAALLWFTLFWFYGRRGSYAEVVGPPPPWGGLRGLVPFFFMVGTSVVARMLLPLLTGRLLGRGPLDYGWRLRGTFRLWWVYAALVALILPAVVWASSTPRFLAKYPWCKQAIEGGTMDLGVFALYAAALFAFYASGEAFWRGFLLFGTERRLGTNALFLTLVPYVVGHFGKPPLETLGAIASGLVLGYLALQHRSFWLGALTHWGVAMSMDLAALWRKGVVFVAP